MSASPRPLMSSILLNTRERDRLDDWGNRAVLTAPPSRGTSIPEAYARHVGRAPAAPALTFAGRTWTYRELDLASNRLAHRLVELGAGPGECVTVLSRRSDVAVMAILAVLKSGAAYLPIDPVSPNARIEFMIGDARSRIAVTTADLATRLATSRVTVVDAAEAGDVGRPAPALPLPDPDDVAHVIYTSGTTGRPKGVAVTHRNVTRLFDRMDVGVALTPEQVWTQCHSLAFDYSEIGRAHV